ncbi:low temperature requirement protein A [Micromonospora sp. WMMD980]|uniref:low temperature requirement protein A n=1 Tax=Micromonospora sp. WMMD980 TaxID=3016088 RepID=UPI00241743BA|nr:low temperature requirement protein A [Micromonospora sp. WMMD980]MDG4801430.1 low temperature requirement protein A [Micromonospora sp. WMMD980]
MTWRCRGWRPAWWWWRCSGGCWTGFVALGNVVRADHGVLPVLGLGIVAVVFVLAITIPQAFVDQPDDLPGPLVFAGAYLVVRALTSVGFLFVLTRAGHTRVQLGAVTVPPLLAAVFIGVSLTAPWWVPAGAVLETRLVLWTAALLVEYAVGLVLPYAHWSLPSAGHWAERHGLIVLVALGEVVISLGVGPGRFDRLALTTRVITASVLGIALVAALWWLHFDSLAAGVEQVLHGTRGPVRVPLARDAYTYLHLVTITGVVTVALGLKLLLEAVAVRHSALSGPVSAVLHGGVVIYLASQAAVARRAFRRTSRSTLVGMVLIAALAVPGAHVAPLVALAVLVAVCGALAVLQRMAGERGRIKAALRREEHAVEEAVSAWRKQYL